MSKQQIEELRARFAMYLQQESQQIEEDREVRKQINAARAKESSLYENIWAVHADARTKKTKLDKLQSENTKISKEITAEQAIISRIKTLLEGYSEYVAPEEPPLPTTLMTDGETIAEMLGEIQTNNNIEV